MLPLALPQQVSVPVHNAHISTLRAKWPSFPIGRQLHRATATIIEPTGESDNPLKFTTGLVVALDLDATLEHVQDPQTRVKVEVGDVVTQRPAIGWMVAVCPTAVYFMLIRF